MSKAKGQPSYSISDVENNFVALDYEKIEKRLDLLSNDMRVSVIRSALRASSKPIKAEMTAGAPYRKGYLQSGIGVKITMDKAAGDGYAIVGAFRKVLDASGYKRSQAYKAGWLEYGTQNMKARPFIKQSFEAREREIPKQFSEALEKNIKKRGF